MSGGVERPRFPLVSEIRQLPRSFQTVAPPDWADRNGHVNVQYYMTLYELSGWLMMDGLALDDEWFDQRQLGEFDLEHHIFYRNEIRIGDQVSTYHRVLGRSEKRFHGMLFIVNDSRDSLAASLEFVTAAVDLRIRRMTELPAEVKAGLDRLLERHDGLSWPAPKCGILKP